MTHPTLHGDRVLLRPVRPSDRPGIRAMLEGPEVARWWPSDDPDAEAGRLIDRQDGVLVLAIERGGTFVGVVMVEEEDDPDYRHAGLDISLDTAFHGQGLGRDALRAVARYLIDERGHHRLTIDPAADNERAIAAYRAVGFRPVGTMRRYERGPDGTFHDGLLMDLLADELT